MTKNPIQVAISGAAGQIGYSLIPLVCSGKVFGENQPISLRLLDITPMLSVLNGVVMEIRDCVYPLLTEISATDSYENAFKNVDWAILVGGFPRKQGMLRKDLLAKNVSIFRETGKALDKFASENVKIVVVANPANTNALVLSKNAPSIPKTNISALTRLDMNRAIGFLSSKLQISPDKITNAIIWGNHSKTQVPDAFNALIENKSRIIDKFQDKDFFLTDFVSMIQNRGAEVIQARKLSSAMSAANAIKDHVHDWVFGTKSGEYVSMSVISDENPYDIEKGLYFSFPVTIQNGKWSIVSGIDIQPEIKVLIKNSEKELIEERLEAQI